MKLHEIVLNQTLIPLLLDLDFKEISGPLSQFQAKKADLKGIRELASSLNKAAQVPVPEAQFEKLFAALWSDLDKSIATIPKGSPSGKNSRPQGEILEELVSSVRTVEMRMRDVMDEEPTIRKRRRYRIHPGAIREYMQLLSNGPRDPIRILIIGSLLREDFPWMYELAAHAHRALASDQLREGRAALIRFADAIEMLQRGPFAEEFGGDRTLLKLLSNEVFEILGFSRIENDESPKNVRARITKNKELPNNDE